MKNTTWCSIKQNTKKRPKTKKQKTHMKKILEYEKIKRLWNIKLKVKKRLI